MSGRKNTVAILGRLGVHPMVRLSLSGRRLVAYLAVRGEAAPRAVASEALWPGLPDDASRANLRRALWQLPHGWVAAAADELALDADTDYAHARRVAARALSGGELTFAEIDLLSNDILPGWYEDWVLPTHEAFHLLRVQALEAACRTLAAVGDFALATHAGSAALAAEPLRESAAEALIDVHLAQRNRYEALQCFRSLAQRLEDELGVTPDPTLARRVQALAPKRRTAA